MLQDDEYLTPLSADTLALLDEMLAENPYDCVYLQPLQDSSSQDSPDVNMTEQDARADDVKGGDDDGTGDGAAKVGEETANSSIAADDTHVDTAFSDIEKSNVQAATAGVVLKPPSPARDVLLPYPKILQHVNTAQASKINAVLTDADGDTIDPAAVGHKGAPFKAYDRKTLTIRKKHIKQIAESYHTVRRTKKDSPSSYGEIFAVHDYEEQRQLFKGKRYGKMALQGYDEKKQSYTGPVYFTFDRDEAVQPDIFPQNIDYLNRTYAMACRHPTSRFDRHPWCFKCYILSKLKPCCQDADTLCVHGQLMCSYSMKLRREHFRDDSQQYYSVAKAFYSLSATTALPSNIFCQFDATLLMLLKLYHAGVIAQPFDDPAHLEMLLKHFKMPKTTSKQLGAKTKPQEKSDDVEFVPTTKSGKRAPESAPPSTSKVRTTPRKKAVQSYADANVDDETSESYATDDSDKPSMFVESGPAPRVWTGRQKPPKKSPSGKTSRKVDHDSVWSVSASGDQTSSQGDVWVTHPWDKLSDASDDKFRMGRVQISDTRYGYAPTSQPGKNDPDMKALFCGAISGEEKLALVTKGRSWAVYQCIGKDKNRIHSPWASASQVPTKESVKRALDQPDEIVISDESEVQQPPQKSPRLGTVTVKTETATEPPVLHPQSKARLHLSNIRMLAQQPTIKIGAANMETYAASEPDDDGSMPMRRFDIPNLFLPTESQMTYLGTPEPHFKPVTDCGLVIKPDEVDSVSLRLKSENRTAIGMQGILGVREYSWEEVQNLGLMELRTLLEGSLGPNPKFFTYQPNSLGWYHMLAILRTMGDTCKITDDTDLLLPMSINATPPEALGPAYTGKTLAVPGLNLRFRPFSTPRDITATGNAFILERSQLQRNAIAKLDPRDLLSTFVTGSRHRMHVAPFMLTQQPEFPLRASRLPNINPWGTKLKGIINSKFAYPVTDTSLRYTEELARLSFYNNAQREHDLREVETNMRDVMTRVYKLDVGVGQDLAKIWDHAWHSSMFHLLDDYARNAELLQHTVHLRRQGFLGASQFEPIVVRQALSQPIWGAQHILE